MYPTVYAENRDCPLSKIPLQPQPLLYGGLPQTKGIYYRLYGKALREFKGYYGMCRLSKSYLHKCSQRSLERNKRKNLRGNAVSLIKNSCEFRKLTALFKSFMKITQLVKSAMSVLPRYQCHLKVSRASDLLIEPKSLLVLKHLRLNWYTSSLRKSWYLHPNTKTA